MPHTLFECKIFIPRIGRNSWQNRFRRAKQRRRESRCYPRMGRLQAVIAYRAAGRQAAVHQRGPAFEFVVTVAMKKIGRADGDPGRCGFNGGKGRMIVHDIVGQENLLPAPPALIQSRKIVERARRPDAGKQPAILFVPETVLSREIFPRGFADFRWALGGGRGLLFCRLLPPSRLYDHAGRQQQQQFSFRPIHGSQACGSAFLPRTPVLSHFRSLLSTTPAQMPFVAPFATFLCRALSFRFRRGILEIGPLKCFPRSSSCPAPYYCDPPSPPFWLARCFPWLSLGRRILSPSRKLLAAPAKRKRAPPSPRRSSPTTRWTGKGEMCKARLRTNPRSQAPRMPP